MKKLHLALSGIWAITVVGVFAACSKAEKPGATAAITPLAQGVTPFIVPPADSKKPHESTVLAEAIRERELARAEMAKGDRVPANQSAQSFAGPVAKLGCDRESLPHTCCYQFQGALSCIEEHH